MPTEIPHIVEPEQQLQLIKDTSSFQKYNELYFQFFSDGKRSSAKKNVPWIKWVREGSKNTFFTETSADYFRLLGLVAILFAQVGFPSMEGGKFRHVRKKWAKDHFDPYHQLASACYAAGVNEQGYNLKESTYRQLLELDKTIAIAVWGFMFDVRKSQTDDFYLLADTPQEEALERYLESRKICLPTRELNKRLAELGFDGDTADTISEEAFQTQVYPEAASILEPLLNPEAALLQHKKTRWPFRRFSYPKQLSK